MRWCIESYPCKNLHVSVSFRIVELCKDYSIRRHAFGSPVYKYPLHMRTLADMEVSGELYLYSSFHSPTKAYLMVSNSLTLLS